MRLAKPRELLSCIVSLALVIQRYLMVFRSQGAGWIHSLRRIDAEELVCADWVEVSDEPQGQGWERSTSQTVAWPDCY